MRSCTGKSLRATGGTDPPGRLGGRPRKPTVEEARQAALDELVPRALKVLKAHLGEGDDVNPDAWRAALRVFEHQFGRAPEQVDEIVLPAQVEGVAALTWQQPEILAATLIGELAGIESWFAKLKERCIWLHKFETLDQAREVIAAHVYRYHHRPHPGLAYRT
jgi:hypothetical protein